MFDRTADDPYAQLADLFLSHDATIRGANRTHDTMTRT